MHQCAKFAKDFFTTALHHIHCSGAWKDCQGFSQAWTAGPPYVNVALSAESANPDADDPLFVFRKSNTGWNGTTESPREADVLVFEDGGPGHFVIAKGASLQLDGTLNVPIIEENIAAVNDYGPGGSCYNRVLVGTKQSDGRWDIASGFGPAYAYTGFIRHNLAGVYADSGWHEDANRTSQAFRDAYLRHPNGKLGWAFANGKDGTPFVHKVGNLWVQDFVNTDPNNRFGTDGQAMIVLNETSHHAYVIREGFLAAYRCLVDTDPNGMGGITLLGAPFMDEAPEYLSSDCRCIGSGVSVPSQLFEKGCMWWGKGPGCPDPTQDCVHVHSTVRKINGTNKGPNCSNIAIGDNPPGANNVCTDECNPGESRCASSSVRQYCGKLDMNTCHTWMNQNCASPTVCSNGTCTDPAYIQAASTGVGGGPVSSGNGGLGGASAPSGIERCTQSAVRCVSNPEQYEMCIRDYTNGGTNWTTFSCSSGQVCSNGSCVTPTTPASSASSSSPSSELVRGGQMTTDPLQNGWRILAYDGNYENVTTTFQSSGGRNGSGAIRIQANAQGEKDWSAQFVSYPSIQGSARLTACLSAMSETARTITIFLQADSDPWTNEGLWQSISLSTATPTVPSCTTFTVPSGISDTHARFGLNFGDATSAITIDAFTLTMGEMGSATPAPTSAIPQPSTPAAPTTPVPIGDTRITLAYAASFSGTVTLNAWWQPQNAGTRSWSSVEGCRDLMSSGGVYTCTFGVPSGSSPFEFQLDRSDGSYWGDESNNPKGGKGATNGIVTLTTAAGTLSYVMKENPAPYYLGHIDRVP